MLDYLKSANLMQILSFTSYWLARDVDPGRKREEVSRRYVESYFSGVRLIQARGLVSDGRVFVVPQLLHLLAKLALIYSSVDGEQKDLEEIALLPLALGDHIDPDVGDGGGVHEDGLPGKMARELVSNQHFNRPLDLPSVIASFSRRWREIPSEQPHLKLGSFEILFRESVGVELDHLEMVTLAAYVHTMLHEQPIVPVSYFRKLGLSDDEVVQALKHVAGTPEKLKFEIVLDHQSADGDLRWSIAPFERFPLLGVQGGVIVLDPKLLIHRVFGWLPYFDVEEALRPDKKKVGQLREYAGRVSEVYGLEVVASLAPKGVAKSLYSEEDLRRAFGSERKVVDAVIDFGDAWIVLDVSTRRLMRGSVAGTSAEALKKDLETLVGAKAKQLAATIEALRTGSERLTGASLDAPRRFHPVVVASEGFPVNPMTTSIIEDMLRRSDLLQEPDVGDLQIVDIAELELVEAVQQYGGPSFPELLKGKEGSGLYRASLRDYILVERGIKPKRSERLDKIWQGLFDRIVGRLKQVEESGDADQA
ncbi:hypothetical protein ABTZ21_01205 [Streptomyces sp. NPDC096191]|uniref:hypothetical protein n=1 Tax=Streptomyces sp. NPDC096191 TaxID=3155426 RepID=UPI00333242D5